MNRYAYQNFFDIKLFNLKKGKSKTLKFKNEQLTIDEKKISKKLNASLLLKEFEKLRKKKYFLELANHQDYKNFLNVNIVRHYGIAYEIRKYFYSKWTFQNNIYTIDKEEFLGIMEINFPEHYEHFEILFRCLDKEYLSVQEFFESFICPQIEKSKFDFNELHKVDKKGKENITREHLKIWIGYFTVQDEKDLNSELLIKLTNWVLEDDGLAVLLSDIENSGFGLFTKKKIPEGATICEYGGRLTNYINEKSENNFYLIIHNQTEDTVFYDFIFDAYLHFRINQPGRYANDTKENVTNNAEYQVTDRVFHHPCSQVVSTKEIEAYSEIYATYGEGYWGKKEKPKKSKPPKVQVIEEVPVAIVDTPLMENQKVLDNLNYFLNSKYQKFNFTKENIYVLYNLFKIEYSSDRYARRQNLDVDDLAKESIKKITDKGSLQQFKSIWRQVLKNTGVTFT